MMASTRDSLQRSDDEEELVFDQTGLLTNKLSSRHGVVSRSHAANAGGRLTVARTVNLCLSFFGLGLCFAIPTATIQDLQKRTNAEASIEHIYTARYGGYIFGCLIGGFLFDWYNRQFLLFLSIFATSIGIIVMPFCAQLATLMACSAITGITMGFLDTGGNVWCLDLWGRHSAPFMQALHFCFALGALVAPLIAEPFLSPASLSGITPMHGLANASLAPTTFAHIPPIGIHHGIVVTRPHKQVTPHWMHAPPFDGVSRPRRSAGEPDNSTVELQQPVVTEIFDHNDTSSLNETAAQLDTNSTLVESNDTSRVENTTGNRTQSSTKAPSTTVAPKKPTKPMYAEGVKEKDKWDRKSQKDKAGASVAAPNSTKPANATSAKSNSTVQTPASKTNQSLLLLAAGQTNASAPLASAEGNDTQDVNKTLEISNETSSENITTIPATPASTDPTIMAGKINASLEASTVKTPDVDPSTTPKSVTEAVASSSKNPSESQVPTTRAVSIATDATVNSSPPEVNKSSQPIEGAATSKATTKTVQSLTTQRSASAPPKTVESVQTTAPPPPRQSYQPPLNNIPDINLPATEMPEYHTSKKTSISSPQNFVPTATVPALMQSSAAAPELDTPKKNVNTDPPSLIEPTLLEKPPTTTAEPSLTTWIAHKFMENRIGKLEVVYAILGVYLFVVSVVFLAFLCTSPRDSRSRQEEHVKAPGPSSKRSLVLLSSLFFFLYMGMEAAVGELLQIYAAHPTGSVLTYVFWGSFAAARFLAIPIAIKVSCRNMLLGDLGVCFLASVLLVAGADRMESLLWTGVGVLGVGMASVLPTSLAWLERHMRVTNRTASVVLLGAAFGEMALPFLASHFIEREPAVLVYVNVSVVTLCCLNFGVLWLAAAKRGEKYASDEPDRSLYQLASLDDADDQADFTLLRPLYANGENGTHFKEKQRFSRGLSATS